MSITAIGVAVHASAFRCTGGLITEGDHKTDVIRKCGQPTFKESWQEERVRGYIHRRTGAYEAIREIITVEKWTYNMGTHRFVRHLILEKGEVVDIETGEYGYLEDD